MDDLISRKAAVTRISDLLILELKGQRIPTWNEVYNAIGDIPSSPAVPLDKLCERLVNFKCPSCAECQLYGIKCGEYGVCGSKAHWMAVLTKWMEGLDGNE